MSPQHLSDSISIFKTLEMNNSTKPSHLERTCSPSVSPGLQMKTYRKVSGKSPLIAQEGDLIHICDL